MWRPQGRAILLLVCLVVAGVTAESEGEEVREDVLQDEEGVAGQLIQEREGDEREAVLQEREGAAGQLLQEREGDEREDVLQDEEGATGQLLQEREGDERAVPGSCPACDERKCMTDMTCTGGKVLVEDTSVCGCCPACVPLLGLGDLCSPTFGPKCSPGLECDPTTTKCIVQKQRSCDSFAYLDVLWKPECLADGSYAPKQCKGETLTGRCFCTGGDGHRLFGQEWWARAQNMTCACSRDVWQLQQEGRTDVTLHCDLVGNYEPLQCDNGLCWCAEPRTGQPITAVLPQDNVRVLPCYNVTALGSQYLRQCESLLISQAKIGVAMSAHGTYYPISSKTYCDPDGSYSNYQLDTFGRCYCSWKDSSPLGSWAIDSASMAGVNCNCARDWRYYKDNGLELPLVCNGNGNYEPIQRSGSMFYCVDSDGYAISLPQPDKPECSRFISAP